MTFYTAFFTLLLVMDPVGNIPIFFSLLKQVEVKRRKFIIIRECFIAFLVLIVFFLVGKNILSTLGISQAALGLSGGIILFLISIKMIFPPHEDKAQNFHALKAEPFIVPLAIPLIAGPSSIAIVMLLAHKNAEKFWLWLGAIAVASLVSAIILLFANQLLRFFKERLIIAIERLMGMLLVALSVQMILVGIQSYFHLKI